MRARAVRQETSVLCIAPSMAQWVTLGYFLRSFCLSFISDEMGPEVVHHTQKVCWGICGLSETGTCFSHLVQPWANPPPQQFLGRIFHPLLGAQWQCTSFPPKKPILFSNILSCQDFHPRKHRDWACPQSKKLREVIRDWRKGNMGVYSLLVAAFLVWWKPIRNSDDDNDILN